MHWWVRVRALFLSLCTLVWEAKEMDRINTGRGFSRWREEREKK